ncbi:hypothetical protein GQ43DRAFT_387626 [Delitschia confertaspora ATCC 74209]|uniref:Nucleoside-diphosphate-sugar epimerase n=1 Tax=Delitschia confertaspora ATCC 74209 TaxID=1513339 RepID=A0A9P4JUF3_9PLEO|nr:hypothetical protein GQ43DRAFT_387626 [Delitschia confertaspora ATCC 74209]
MHLILTGATGLIGAGVLQHMLAVPEVTQISILSRRPVAMADGHDKAKVIIHKDFDTYDKAVLEALKDAQGCVWALGVSQNAVNKTEFYKVTHDYPVAAAKAFSTLHPESPFTFVLVSGEGATQSPTMFTPHYGKVKGEAEASLLELNKATPNFRPISVRPAGVDWRHHPEIHPFIPQQAMYKKTLLPLIDTVYKNMVTPTRPLSKILTELALSKGERLEGSDISGNGRIVSNVAIRRMAGL